MGHLAMRLRLTAGVLPLVLRSTRLLALLVVLGMAGLAWGQWPESHPSVNPDHSPDHSIVRDSGFYLSWPKLLILWLVFLIWLKTTDWISRDCQMLDLPFALWVPLAFFPFMIALFAAGMTIPVFPAGAAVTVLAWLVPTLVYVFKRNSIVDPHERVMTPSHLRFMAAEQLNKIGIKVAAEARAAHERGAKVDFQAIADDLQKAQANLISARQSPGFLTAKSMIANAVDHFAEKIMLDVAGDGVTTRFQVDGVWHDSDSRDSEEGDRLITVLKLLSGLSPKERRKRQQGVFSADYEGRSLKGTIVSQGTKTGERTIISFTKKGVSFSTLEELGMRSKMIERLKELMLTPQGMFLFTSMPGGGLSTTMYVALKATDRLLRDFISVEDKQDPLYEVENVDPAFYDSAQGGSPLTELERLARKQPDVMIVPNLTDGRVVEMLCELCAEDLFVFGSLRAKSAIEALLRVLLLKVPAKKFAPRIVGVLNQRLIRRLCETCKEEFEPPPALIKKLGIPAGRVKKLYRHPENPEKVCPDCHGIGYRNRTGIFELLTVDATIREGLIKQPKLDILQTIARKAGHRSLQEEGMGLVLQGVTSLPELMRILKQ